MPNYIIANAEDSNFNAEFVDMGGGFWEKSGDSNYEMTTDGAGNWSLLYAGMPSYHYEGGAPGYVPPADNWLIYPYAGTSTLTVAAAGAGSSGSAERSAPNLDALVFALLKSRDAHEAAIDALQDRYFSWAATDDVTPLTTGDKASARLPFPMSLTAVVMELTTASSSGAVTVDLEANGVSILSTPVTIDASEEISTTAATPAVISDAALAQWDKLTPNITGAGTNAAGLKIHLIGTRP